MACARRERPSALREAKHELAQRVGPALEEGLGQPAGRHHAERVAVAARVLGGEQPRLACEPDLERPSLGDEHRRERLVVLAGAKVAATAQHVVQLVGVARAAAELRLHVGERIRVDQLAQLLLPQQLPQQIAVERKCLRAPLGRRRVVLVHVRRDVVEEERRGERRGRHGLDVDEVELARLQPTQDLLQRGQVEDVLETLAVGLEHDRERAVFSGYLQQPLCLQTLLPERRALTRAAARDQQGAGGVLAEARAEERSLPHLVDDQLLDLVGWDQQVGNRRQRVGVRQVERDPVVRPDRLHLDPERVPQAGRERHPPGRVHPATERRQDADAPVADLVTEALDHDRPVGWHHAGGCLLLARDT